MSDEKATGTFAPPPANAPYEVAQDLSPELVAQHRAAAAANERALRPLTYDQPGESLAPKTDVQISGEKHLAETLRIAAQMRARHPNPTPAASETDSPSRGMPRPIDDPGKRITGGFGDVGEAQYFPLDGSELKELVHKLLDKLNARIENDLRFHIAVTYPRVRCAVTIHVEGFGFTPFDVAAVTVAEKTPVDVAEAHGAVPIDFDVVEERREFDDEGNPENPPDRIRDDLGITKPRKQWVETGTGKLLVDVVPDLSDSF